MLARCLATTPSSPRAPHSSRSLSPSSNVSECSSWAMAARSTGIAEKTLGPDHPNVGTVLNNLAGLYFVQRDWARAADYWRHSTSVTVRRARRGTDDVGQTLTGKRKSEAEQLNFRFWGLIKTVYRLASEGRGADAGLAREMLLTAQWASASEAARSLAQMAVRTATGDPALSR